LRLKETKKQDKMTDIINRIKNKLNKDIHLKELLKGSSIAFVLRIIGIIAGYIFTLLITRGYGDKKVLIQCYKIIFDVKLLPQRRINFNG